MSQFVGIDCGTVSSWGYVFSLGSIKGVPLPWKWDGGADILLDRQATPKKRQPHQGMPTFIYLGVGSPLDSR